MAKDKKPTMGAWLDQLNAAVGRFIRLETVDGIERSGKMTAFRTKQIKFNGVQQDVITDLELNGDPSDTVTIGSLVSIHID